ncbi:hypothetical protein HSBAA_49170 [Vreelandella sulfidaeris]|uniref:S-formylglutathione hydrolase YeiG n=1 Tax=Vreelandella sulfidaeris TaxID=115553 RepID=A0A455UG67_9GAMM|nr:hypothetical protein HSBAA_49170 [Halomonas sulfidaeris]
MSMSETLELVSANRSFGGWHKRYRHYSRALDCDMVFAVYLPPQAENERVPLLWWLSGLTCNDENFMQKPARTAWLLSWGWRLFARTPARGAPICPANTKATT